MDSRKSGPPPPPAAPAQVISEHYEPKCNLSIVANVYTFEIQLQPEFKKEQIRLQLTGEGKMRILLDPERKNKWITLKTEFSVPKKTERGDISAKFENGILRITVQKQEKGSVPATPQPPKPAAEEQKTREEPSKKAEEQAKGENNTSQSANGQKLMEEASKKAGEQAKGENNTSQTSTKSVQDTESTQAQRLTANGHNTREEASKKSEEQTKCSTPTSHINGKAVSEDAPEKEGAKSTQINGMTNKSTSSKKEERDTRNATMTEHPCTDLARKLRTRGKMLKVALVVLVVVGIGLYVNEMIKSSGEAKE